MIAALPLVAFVLAPFVAAAATPLAYRRWPRATSTAAVGLGAALFAAFVSQAPAISRGEVVEHSIAWAEILGVRASFRLDGLGLLFALLITGIGALVLAYSPAYMRAHGGTARLLALLLAFLGSMLGLVLADDAITLFVFWELTSIASFFLIAFDGSEVAREKARQALLVTSAGGLALLVGFLVLAGGVPGGGISVALSSLATAELRDHPHYTAIVVLIALGAFTKSAQMPLHFWLPGAMVAPTPVSTYLHSATMVKAGVYLLARMHPSLGGTALWTGLLGTVGAVTFAGAAVLATLQRDLKLVLAYATVSILGALVMLIGIGTHTALVAAVVMLIAHAAYKATLFLVAGSYDHEQGTRDPFAATGAGRTMPGTALAAVIAAASMAGVPPLVGVLAKDEILAAGIGGPWPAVVTAVSLLASACLVAAAWIAGPAPFARGSRGPWRWHDVPVPMLVGPIVLAVLGIVLGILPDALLDPIAAPAASAIAGAPTTIELSPIPSLSGAHGLAFVLGLASLLAGTLVYLAIARKLDAASRIRAAIERFAAARAFDAAMARLEGFAKRVTSVVQHGQLPRYLVAIVLTMIVAVSVPMIALAGEASWSANIELGIYEAPVAATVAAGALAAAMFRDRLASIASLAASGLGVVFLFALFSGPDLAITQLVVETMLAILLVLVIRRLPRAAIRRAAGRRHFGRGLAAIGAGLLVSSLLLFATSTIGFEAGAAKRYVELGATQDFDNVVNAILVNFRALDTLGEITVLAIAALGVFSLVAFPSRTRKPR